jgi:hypothetical protein
MMREISWRQFLGWQVFYALDPFGERHEDLRIGTLTALVANAVGTGKKTFIPEDFMPFLRDDSKPGTSQRPATQKDMKALKQQFKAYALAGQSADQSLREGKRGRLNRVSSVLPGELR